MKLAKISAFALIAAITSPVYAQDSDADTTTTAAAENADKGALNGDWVTVGIGAGYTTSYDGSDEYVFFPAPIAQGSVGGFDFGARGPGLYVDVIRDGNSDSNVKIVAGPLVRVRLDRHSKIKDTVVRLLGKRDVAVEVGATVGVQIQKVLHDYDQLALSTDVQWDVAGAHGGRLITPSISYTTPLSPGIITNLNLNAVHVDDDYARTYFSVDPAGSLASGLPVFDADGGWKSYGATFLVGADLSGDIRDGGWGLFGLVGYSRMTGDAKRSPVTSIRGDADQWFFAGGVNYTF